jgi:hypothetical protein
MSKVLKRFTQGMLHCSSLPKVELVTFLFLEKDMDTDCVRNSGGYFTYNQFIRLMEKLVSSWVSISPWKHPIIFEIYKKYTNFVLQTVWFFSFKPMLKLLVIEAELDGSSREVWVQDIKRRLLVQDYLMILTKMMG